MSDERKYEVLPGVELPDMKTIKEAASDFSASGVNDIQIKSPAPVFTSAGVPADRATAAELAALQELGEEVAENEKRIAEESRRRMSEIMSSAVQAPESLADLINYNRDKMSEEAIKQAEEKIKKEEDLRRTLEEQQKAREERRQLQQRLLEEARERAAAEREAIKRGIKADPKLLEPEKVDVTTDEEAEKEVEKTEAPAEKPAEKIEEKVEEKAEEKVIEKPAEKAAEEEGATIKAAPASAIKPAAPSIPDEPVKPAIASDDETYDDFSEFFDDNK